MLAFPSRTTDTGIVVIDLGEKLDAYTVDEFFFTIQDHLDKGNTLVVINCDGLDYLSSIGIGTVVRIHHHTRQLSARVVYAAIPPAPLDALRLVCLDNVLEIYESLDDACARADRLPRQPNPAQGD